jgi:2-methylisocitrate lyase-like PEP mutase family enzyme
MGGPVSVLAELEGPSLAELQDIGVARVSMGPGTLAVAMEALRRAAEAMLAGGELPPALGFNV